MSEERVIPFTEIDVKKLPSRGVPYPKGATLKYRNYTWGEVRQASVSNVGVAEALKNSLSGVEASFDKQSLTVADALYIGILRKISTFSGMEIEVPYICGNCGKANKGTFTEKDISFRDLPAEVTELPITVDWHGRELQMAPMTVKQYYELNSGRYDKLLPNGKITDVAVQACWIKNIGFEEAYKLIFSANDVEDIEVITQIDKLMLHDMERLSFKCENKKCGYTNKVKLEGREALLRPFREREKPLNNRISIGKRAEPANKPDNANGV